MLKTIEPVIAWATLNQKGQIDKSSIWKNRQEARDMGHGPVKKVFVIPFEDVEFVD
jgi:hypothetical protein